MTMKNGSLWKHCRLHEPNQAGTGWPRALPRRALRSGVVFSALDPRGLYTIIPGSDATQDSTFLNLRPDLMIRKETIIREGLNLNEQVLYGLAEDTGERFFHNRNDWDQGFRQLVTAPEIYKEDIQQAAYSQDDLKELPIEVHTRFYKLNASEEPQATRNRAVR